MDAVEYGLICDRSDEKDIVKNVNAYLAEKGYRKLYKWKDKGGIKNIDDPSSDPKLEYTYGQFIKESPKWYFDILPNKGLRSIYRFAEQKDCAWTLFFSKTNPESCTESDNIYLDNFLKDLLTGTGYKSKLLYKYSGDGYRR